MAEKNIIFKDVVYTDFKDVTITVTSYSMSDDYDDYIVKIESDDGVRTVWMYEFKPTSSYGQAMEIVKMCEYYINEQDKPNISGYTLICRVYNLVEKELRDSRM